MKYCAYCNAALSEDAQFCGSCGNAIDIPVDGFTRISSVRHPELPASTPTPRISLPGIATTPELPEPLSPDYAQRNFSTQQTAPLEMSIPTLPIDEEEEERRRRAALWGIGLIGIDAFPQGNSVPMVQGALQPGGVPTVQGTPQVQGGSFQNMQAAGQAASIHQLAPQMPFAPAPMTPSPLTPTPSSPPLTIPQHPHGGTSTGSTNSGSPAPKPQPGCTPLLIICAIVIPIIIFASIIGLGLTILAPSLALNGSSSVVLGSNLVLYGNHFLPGSSISLTLDHSTPVYVTNQNHRNVAASTSRISSMQDTARVLSEVQAGLLLAGSSTIKASGDGAFNLTITIDPAWSLGQHIITAEEVLTHRSASLLFTIVSGVTSPTPSPTGTGTKTPNPTPSKTKTPGIIPSPTPSPTATTPPATTPTAQPGLSCINPASVSLGPVSENYAEAVSASVQLCAGGNGVVQWTANWDESQATWLALSTTSGQINAPGQAQLSVSANAAQLEPGNYSVTITFSSTSSSTTQELNVSFQVQAGCLKISPSSLSFTGVASTSDPASRSISLTNCGAVGTWTANDATSDGANWLSVNRTSDTLANGGSEKVTISASNLNAQLAAGTYTGSVTFTIGSSSFVVQVTLTVQSPPTISANPTSLTGSIDCPSPNGGAYLCSITLMNNSQSASLTWTYSAQSIPSLVVNAASFTIAPGQTEQVQLNISVNDCSNGASITFTGPANSVTVAWQCYPPIQ